MDATEIPHVIVNADQMVAMYDDVAYRLVTTKGPCTRGVLMGCGRYFWSHVKGTATDRKMRYWDTVVRKHERRCTRCKQYKQAHQATP